MKILSTHTEPLDDIPPKAVSTFAAIKIVLRIFIQRIGAEPHKRVINFSFSSCVLLCVYFYFHSEVQNIQKNVCDVIFPSVNHLSSLHLFNLM